MIINVGCGSNFLSWALNMDLEVSNEANFCVTVGNANDLPFKDSTVNIVVMQSPYKYDPLKSDASRVIRKDGLLIVVGNLSNPHFKEVWDANRMLLGNKGYILKNKGPAPKDLQKSFRTSGEQIPPETLKEVVLRRL